MRGVAACYGGWLQKLDDTCHVWRSVVRERALGRTITGMTTAPPSCNRACFAIARRCPPYIQATHRPASRTNERGDNTSAD